MTAQDAITLLDDDHNQAARLFQQIKAAHSPNEKRVLTQQLCQALRVHMEIEEEIFYPAFRQATGDQHRVDDGEREHGEARAMMDRLEAARLPDDHLVLELEDAILHHVNDEREKMFPEARKARGLDLMALGAQLMRRKQELMAGHPA